MLKFMLCGCAMMLLAGSAIAAPAAPVLPPNTIRCKDFTHNPDGSWTAHADAKPFTLGSVKDMTIRSSVFSRGISIGDYDLASILEMKCLQGLR